MTQAFSTIVKYAGGGAWKFLKKIASGAANAAAQLAKLAGRAITGGIKTLARWLSAAAGAAFKLFRRTKQQSGGLKLSLRDILRYGFGIRSLFVLFNRLRSAIKESFDSLATYDPRVRASLGALSASLNTLKGSLAPAFAPILEAVTPALTALINLVTQAVNAIGMFNAALTGRSYYTVAQGISSIGSAASSATGSAKELKRELAGFDQLNILGAKNSGAGASGSSGKPSEVAYNNVPIDSAIADFVGRLRELAASGDWEGIGQALAEGLNKAFEHARMLVSWDRLGGKITEAVTAITGTINGMLDGINWESLGAAFGEGITTIGRTINLALKNLNLAGVGQAIGRALNGLVDKVDATELGEGLARLLTAKLVVLASAVTTFKWDKFGEKLKAGFESFLGVINDVIDDIPWGRMGYSIAAGVNSLIDLNWNYVGSTLAKSFNGVLDVFGAAVKNIKWGQIGYDLASGLNGMIRKFNWGYLGQTIHNAFTGVLDFGQAFLDTFDATTFGDKVRRAFEKIKWNEIAEKAQNLLKTAFQKIGGFFEGLFGSTNVVVDNASDIYSRVIVKDETNGFGDFISRFSKALLKAITDAISEIPWTDLGNRLHTFLTTDIDWPDIFDAILSFLRTALISLFEFLGATIFGDRWEGIKKMLGIDTSTAGGTKNTGTSGSKSGTNNNTDTGGKSTNSWYTPYDDEYDWQEGWQGLWDEAEEKAENVGKKFEKPVTHAAERAEVAADKAAGSQKKLQDRQEDAWERFVQEGQLSDAEERNGEIYHPGKGGKTSAELFGEAADGLTTASETAQEVFEKQDWLTDREKYLLGVNDTEYGQHRNEVDQGFDYSGNILDKWQRELVAQKVIDHAVETGNAALIEKLKETMPDVYAENQARIDATIDRIQAKNRGAGRDSADERALMGEAKAMIDMGGTVEDVAKSLGLTERQINLLIKYAGDSIKSINDNTGALEDTYDATKDPFSSAYTGPTGRGVDWNFDGTSVDVGVDFTASGNSRYKNDGLLGYLKAVFAPGTDAQTRVELVKKGWSDLVHFVGTNKALSALVGLVKNGWSALSAFVGTDNPLKALINLARGNYTSLGAFVGSSVSALVNLAQGNYTSLSAFVGNAVSAVVNLTKNGSNWAGKTLEQWVGGAVNAIVNLTKQDSNWSGKTLLQWVGGAISVVTNLTKQGSNWDGKTIAQWIGSAINVIANLTKQGSNWAGQTLEQWIGGAVSLIANLTNNGANWNSNGWTLSTWIGGAVSLIANLTNAGANWYQNGIGAWFRNNAGSPTFAADLAAYAANWYQNGVTSWFGNNAGNPYFSANVTKDGANWNSNGNTITKWFAAAAGVVTFVANLVLGTTSSKKKAAGGYISAGGHDYSFATGGAIMRSGRATWWDSVAKYASGTSRAHGTVFVAGEAGPEVLGHVNGRTEILNKSQLAQAIYGAVVSGMGQAVNALGRYLAAHMATCANGIIAAVTRAPELSMLRALEYHAPALATGGVLPYEVAAQLARGTADLQGTLDANNEDLIQTIISVIGAQTAAIVGALQAQQRQGASAGGLSAQQVINEINRRTMMGLQPLKGV